MIKTENLTTMNEALDKYILPDFMDGYRRLEGLIEELERESEDPVGHLLIEKKDLAAFSRVWKAEPAKFVEVIAVRWVETMKAIFETINKPSRCEHCHGEVPTVNSSINSKHDGRRAIVGLIPKDGVLAVGAEGDVWHFKIAYCPYCGQELEGKQ
ncbi:hypothetical protein [Lacticaseibacillus paracasei]|uniref:hypothetical protein n=1 Tax=Lacticaseibacillus paracasei TaxID=1597 RepID=UPI002FF5CBC1